MMSRLVATAVLSCLIFSNTEAKNPLAKLFQMNNNNKDRARGTGSITTVSDGEQTDGAAAATCVSPKAVQILQDQLAKSESARSYAEQEVKNLKVQHAEYKKEAQMRLDQFAQASVAAHKIAKVQEDYGNRVSQLQSKADAELTLVKAVLAEREAEVKSLKDEYEQSTKQLEHLIETRVKETENEWKQSVATSEMGSQSLVSKMQADFDVQLKQLQEEKAILTGERRALQAQFEKVETKYEGMLKDHEAALQVYLVENLSIAVQNEAGDTIQKLNAEIVAHKESSHATIQNLNDKLAAQKESSNATIQQLTLELSALRQSSAAAIETWTEDYMALEASSTATIAKLTVDYEGLQQSNEADLAKAKDASEKALQELRDAAAKELQFTVQKLTASHDKVVASLNEKMESMVKDQKKLAVQMEELGSELKSAKKKYREALKVAEHWESLFEKRSYFNLTHIASDALFHANKAQRDASEALSQAAAPVVQKSRDLYDGHVAPSIAKSKEVYQQYVVPTTNKSRELFDVHVQPHVQQAAKVAHPYYRQYLKPHVDAFKGLVAQVSANVTAAVHACFDEMVAQFGASCPLAIASLRSMEQKTGVSMPPIVMENAKYSCRHPEESVAVFLKATAILVAILLRRFIWRIAWKTLRLFVALLWLISPIRILFFRKRAPAAKPSKAAANGTHTKPAAAGKKGKPTVIKQ